MITPRALWAVAFGFLTLLSGCSQTEPEKTTLGEAARIVTLAPNLTEMAFSLGLGERIVGVGDFCNWPPEATRKPRLGGLINPNLERIIALRPQLAILHNSEVDIGRQLQRVGIGVLVVKSATLLDVEVGIVSIAKQCGVVARGDELLASFRADLAAKPIARGKTIMLTLGRFPGRPAEVRVAGPGTFLDDLVQRLGATNVFQDAPFAYPLVGLEEVLTRAPQVIFELNGESLSPAQEEELRQDWQDFPQLTQGSGTLIRYISGDFAVVPGPRLPLLYQAMAEALVDNTADPADVDADGSGQRTGGS